MNRLINDLQLLFIRDLSSFKDEIELFPKEELLWKTPTAVTNSAGNLTLHVCGNLKHFIGNVLGNTGYVRKREYEFSATSGSRSELIGEIEETVTVLKEVLPVLTEEKLTKIFPVAVGGIEILTVRFLIHLCTHLALHLGQLGYLRRIITENNQSTSPASLKEIGE